MSDQHNNPPGLTGNNPDEAAQEFIKSLLYEREFEMADGGVLTIRQVDLGFISTPTSFPYVSIHPIDSRAPVVRLGRGGGPAARNFEIDMIICVEYEDLDARRGAQRLSHLRWEIFKLLAENSNKFPYAEIAHFEEASMQALTGDDGSFQDWGYIGQILIPCTVTIRGTNV